MAPEGAPYRKQAILTPLTLRTPENGAKGKQGVAMATTD